MNKATGRAAPHCTDAVLAYTPEEARSLARVARSTFYQAVRDGTIPSVRIGKLIRIPKAKFDAMFGLNDAA